MGYISNVIAPRKGYISNVIAPRKGYISNVIAPRKGYVYKKALYMAIVNSKNLGGLLVISFPLTKTQGTHHHSGHGALIMYLHQSVQMWVSHFYVLGLNECLSLSQPGYPWCSYWCLYPLCQINCLQMLENVAIIDPQVAFNLLHVCGSFCRLAPIAWSPPPSLSSPLSVASLDQACLVPKGDSGRGSSIFIWVHVYFCRDGTGGVI